MHTPNIHCCIAYFSSSLQADECLHWYEQRKKCAHPATSIPIQPMEAAGEGCGAQREILCVNQSPCLYFSVNSLWILTQMSVSLLPQRNPRYEFLLSPDQYAILWLVTNNSSKKKVVCMANLLTFENCNFSSFHCFISKQREIIVQKIFQQTR